MKKGLPIKYCVSSIPYCNARIKRQGYSLCCRYGYCGWAEPSQDRGNKQRARQDDFVPIGVIK